MKELPAKMPAYPHVPRIERLRRALNSVEEFYIEPCQTPRDYAGIVFSFVVAFEHAWKCLEDRVADLGYSTRKIIPILETVLAAGLIPSDKESIWLQMLEDKNLAWHIYDKENAVDLCDRIKETHLAALEDLYTKLKGR